MTSVLRHIPPLPGEIISWPATAPSAATQHTLDLDLAPLLGTATSTATGTGAGTGPHPLQARAARFTMAVIEALSGDRPVMQLERWMTPAAFDDLAELAAVMNLCSDAEARARTERPRLLSVHVCEPADQVAEVSGHVRQGQRSRAVALRLERQVDGWLCTAVQVG